MTTPRDDVVVVGAGLAGLTAARLLERLGLSVRVLERGDATGGRIRTDVLSGYRCDRGFQLLNPAYPAVRELIDLRALELRRFDAGVALPARDGTRVVGDPRPGTPAAARARCAAGTCAPASWRGWPRGRHRPSAASSACWRARTSSLAESLDRAGVTGAVRRDIWDPFFAGVLAESDGSTSAQFARLLVRSFVLGRPAVPAAGMAALPGQISAALTSPVHLSTEVTEVRRTRSGVVVASSAGSFAARAVVVAADPVTAGRLAGTSGATDEGAGDLVVRHRRDAVDPAAAVPGLAHLRRPGGQQRGHDQRRPVLRAGRLAPHPGDHFAGQRPRRGPT